MMREAPKDRISSLPDSLLHHIHSFLEFKDGARTCVLSKRWNYIWTTVPVLDLQSRNYSPTSSETNKFMDFVDGTLHRHNSSNLHKFILLCHHHLNESRLHSWVSRVIRGNVKELILHLRQHHPLFIPLSLFTCKSLTLLELDTRPNILLPKYISFPRLKSLELHRFKFTDECWNKELFSNSTALEELILDECPVSMKVLCISIPTLKLLKIDNWITEENGLQDCILKIDAPRLVTFIYASPVAKEFVLSSFQALEEAAVHINFEEYDGAEVSRLLRALAHVKYLSVCSLILKVIHSDYGLLNNLPTFHNVKKLNISGVLFTDQGLIALLKATPNLESLVFIEHMFEGEAEEDDAEGDGDDHNKNDDAAEYVNNDQGKANFNNKDKSRALGIVTTGCLFPHLQSVCFQRFVGNPREMKWVRLILRDAKALQMVTIHYRDLFSLIVNGRSNKKLVAGIPSFPRASPGCVIKV